MTKQIDVEFAKGSFIRDFMRFLKHRRAIRKQRTFCWCPTCDDDLCSNNSFIADFTNVVYICTTCGTKSEWDFDQLAPVLLTSNAK